MADEKQYINISDLKDRFKRRVKWLEKDVHDQYSLGLFHGAEYDAKLIDEIPVADAAEVVHGRWLTKETMARSPFANNFYCSICEQETNNASNFCHNCGAKMDLTE